MLRLAGLIALPLALAYCSRETSVTRTPPVEAVKFDAGTGREEPMTTTTPSSEYIRKLFADAVDCRNRYKCPPLDELQQLVGEPSARAVVTIAFDLMAEGKIRSIDRMGEFTNLVVGEWLLELRNTNKLDPDTAAWCMAQMKRVAATCDPSLIGGLQLNALNSKLPDAIDWVEKEITEPGKTLAEACAAGRFLSQYLEDYTRTTRWLATAGDNGLAAAICSLHRFDHDFFDVERDELPLLEGAARRADLAPEIAYPLLIHVEIHQSDARFRAIAELLAQHPDEGVRQRAAKLAQEP